MEERLEEALARPKFYTTAFVFFAGFALLLAAIGIYGTVACTLAQRRQELGIRLALGTTAERLRGALLWRGLATVAVGSVPGVALAAAFSRLPEGLVQGAGSTGPVVSIAAVLLMAASAAAAIWSATRRIAHLDVIDVLRAG